MEFNYDVIIIGAGPAGLTAALYLSRANLSVAIIEDKAPGGKIPTTAKIENWPGERLIEGPDLAIRIFEHALSFGASYLPGSCSKVEKRRNGGFKVLLNDADGIKEFNSRAVVVASGMINRKPRIQGIEEYENRGVSYCVICDGALYKERASVIIGDGNSAVEEATYLAAIVPKVYVLALARAFKAEPILVAKLLEKDNVEVFYQARPLKVIGDSKGVSGILADVAGREVSLEVGSVFPYIGYIPVANFVADFDIFDQSGFIQTDEDMQTKVAGLFAVGDIRSKSIRQITTAVSDGTIAAKFLSNLLA